MFKKSSVFNAFAGSRQPTADSGASAPMSEATFADSRQLSAEFIDSQPASPSEEKFCISCLSFNSKIPDTKSKIANITTRYTAANVLS